MFKEFQALKWVATVTVPLERLLRRTDQYCWNVAVPMMDGWLVRVLWMWSQHTFLLTSILFSEEIAGRKTNARWE